MGFGPVSEIRTTTGGRWPQGEHGERRTSLAVGRRAAGGIALAPDNSVQPRPRPPMPGQPVPARGSQPVPAAAGCAAGGQGAAWLAIRQSSPRRRRRSERGSTLLRPAASVTNSLPAKETLERPPGDGGPGLVVGHVRRTTRVSYHQQEASKRGAHYLEKLMRANSLCSGSAGPVHQQAGSPGTG